jgi:hypothetical protein
MAIAIQGKSKAGMRLYLSAAGNVEPTTGRPVRMLKYAPSKMSSGAVVSRTGVTSSSGVHSSTASKTKAQ